MARQSRKAEEQKEQLQPRPEPLDKERWEQFCHEYLTDFNVTKAAIRSGFSKKGAGQTGHRLLKYAEIQARLLYLQHEQLRRVDMDAESWKREILALVRADFRELFDDNGALLRPDQWPDDIAAAVASVETKELWDWDPVEEERVFIGYSQKVRRWDKVKALELMARHLKLLTDNVHLTADDELVEALNSGRKRVGRG